MLRIISLNRAFKFSKFTKFYDRVRTYGAQLMMSSVKMVHLTQQQLVRRYTMQRVTQQPGLQSKPLLPPVFPRSENEFVRWLMIKKSPWGDRAFYGPSVGSLCWFLLIAGTLTFIMTRLDDRTSTDAGDCFVSWGFVDDPNENRSSGIMKPKNRKKIKPEILISNETSTSNNIQEKESNKQETMCLVVVNK